MYSNFNADTENMNNGMGNSMGRGNSRPRGTSSRGRGTRHDFYNNSKYFFKLCLTTFFLFVIYLICLLFKIYSYYILIKNKILIKKVILF